MNGVVTHDYKEAVNKKVVYHKTGTLKLLWGLIEVPQGWHETKLTHLHLCKRCGQKEFVPTHGHIKANEQ